MQTAPLTEELRRASRRAGHRIAFLAHVIVFTTVSMFLWFVAGGAAAFIVSLSWFVGLSIHGFFAVAAPVLHARWTAEALAARPALPQGPPRSRLGEAKRHEDALRSNEELAASIAHEIRNPITAAKSLLQQMREDPSCEDNAEYARIAIEELDRVERSVSHLLRYAREEELDLKPCELADVVASAIEGLDERIKKSRARIERDLDFDAQLSGDKDKLRRVVMNLVTNALEAHEESAAADPFVRISCGRDLAGGSVWLRVKDNGGGIDRARLAKIYKPFNTSKKSGTGLGLAITKKLVEAHGGTIEVTSEAGAGTEFVTTFPRAAAPGAAE